jgi:hypothetical protein
VGFQKYYSIVGFQKYYSPLAYKCRMKVKKLYWLGTAASVQVLGIFLTRRHVNTHLNNRFGLIREHVILLINNINTVCKLIALCIKPHIAALIYMSLFYVHLKTISCGGQIRDTTFLEWLRDS